MNPLKLNSIGLVNQKGFLIQKCKNLCAYLKSKYDFFKISKFNWIYIIITNLLFVPFSETNLSNHLSKIERKRIFFSESEILFTFHEKTEKIY